MEQDIIAKGLKMIEESQKAKNNEAVKNGEASEEQENTVEHTICPCCGKPTLVKPVEVKGELLDHYLSCIISGVPFSHTYPIYKGRLEVTVTQLSRETAKDIQTVLNILDICETKLTDKVTLIRDLRNVIKLYCTISFISVKNGDDFTVFHPCDEVAKVCDKIQDIQSALVAETIDTTKLTELLTQSYKHLTTPEFMSAIPGLMLAGLVETHNRLYSILMDAGFDSNFWEGIELA